MAIRTRFFNWLVPEDRVTCGVLRTTVKRLSTFRLLDDQLTHASLSRTRDARRFLLDVFTLWIV